MRDKMKLRTISIIAASALALAAMASCGSSEGGGGAAGKALGDGVFAGRSAEDDTGAYGEATITVEGGKITGCEFVTWQKDGTAKGEDYGKINGEISNQDYYDKAQLAVEAMKLYARELVDAQDPKAVDAVSGATNSYGQFVEAVNGALEEAAK
jgi:major membrane immunogen (membrane-anchored lipoprotein)